MPVRARKGTGSVAGPRAVGSFVPKLTQKSFERYGFATAAVLTDWPAIVGPQLAAWTQPERLRWPRLPGNRSEAAAETGPSGGATLHLRVSSARALDVQYGAAQILERINGYFGYRAVTELRIVQAPITAQNATARAPQAPPAVVGEPANPAIASIESGALREALTRLEASVGRAVRPAAKAGASQV
jgi:hypothetical protein